MGENRHDVLHGIVNNVSWSTKYCVMAHQKVVGLTQQGRGLRQSIPLAPENIMLSWCGPKLEHILRSLNEVAFQSPINLRTYQL